MSVRRVIAVEIEIEGPHAEPDHLLRWLRAPGRGSVGWKIVGVELAKPEEVVDVPAAAVEVGE